MFNSTGEYHASLTHIARRNTLKYKLNCNENSNTNARMLAAMLVKFWKDKVVELINVCFDHPNTTHPIERLLFVCLGTQRISTQTKVQINSCQRLMERSSGSSKTCNEFNSTSWDKHGFQHCHCNVVCGTWPWASCFSPSTFYISKARVLLLESEQTNNSEDISDITLLESERWGGLEMRCKWMWNVFGVVILDDDRVVSDLGKEIRLPYLDENVKKLISSTPCVIFGGTKNLWPESTSGCAVNLELNMQPVWRNVQIQFGSRISKRSGIHLFGSVRKANKARAGVSLCSLDAILGEPC